MQSTEPSAFQSSAGLSGNPAACKLPCPAPFARPPLPHACPLQALQMRGRWTCRFAPPPTCWQPTRGSSGRVCVPASSSPALSLPHSRSPPLCAASRRLPPPPAAPCSTPPFSCALCAASTLQSATLIHARVATMPAARDDAHLLCPPMKPARWCSAGWRVRRGDTWGGAGRRVCGTALFCSAIRSCGRWGITGSAAAAGGLRRRRRQRAGGGTRTVCRLRACSQRCRCWHRQ